MKKIIILVLALCGLTGQSRAQMHTIPVDPNVRIGHLDNGLTYYIRHNALPEKRAEFYIAQKVGSILEEDNQRGLAHFLEHMCFNGTTHFPDNALRDYLQNIGVRFGENLNAYTSVDETVYNISQVPVVRDGIIDSCLLILHDWANDLTLDPKEIDKERGVIHEEWRSRSSAMMRMYEKSFPEMYAGSKYAYRLPIGLMSVVDNFPYKDLRDYYEKWYRPDQQGIIVVGDIDVDAVEAKIKRIFADIKMPDNPAKREYFPVPDNKEPIVTVATDKEQTSTLCYIFFKHGVVPDDKKNDMAYLLDDYIRSMACSMLNTRLAELMMTSKPPYIFSRVSDGDFLTAKTKGAFSGVVACKEGGIPTGFTTMLREIERARRFGFTDTEYDRTRTSYLSSLEVAYNERDKMKNSTYVDEYVRHFIDNEPIPGIETQYKLMQLFVPKVTVKMVNEAMQKLVTDSNTVISIFAPEKEGVNQPTKAEMLALMAEVKAETLTPYEDKTSNEPLVSNLPKPGKIVSVKENGPFGTTMLTLSNGIKVVLKKTDFKADEIRMNGFTFGGTSLFPNEDIPNILALNSVISLGGAGNFSLIDLTKRLAGKVAEAQTVVNTYNEGISASCAPKDLETMMQLVYLKATAPRMDTAAYRSYLSRLETSLKNQEREPMTAFGDSIRSTFYQNHPRTQKMKSNLIGQLDYDRIIEMYKERFADMSGFMFFIVGNIDIDKAKPFIEQYLATLPTTGKKQTFRDPKLTLRQGICINEFSRRLETPKTTILTVYNGKCAYTLENQLKMNILEQTLNMAYIDEVREKEGGTYGVSVSGDIDKYPAERFIFEIVYNTDPDKYKRMQEVVLQQFDKMATEGPSADYLARVKEFMLKKHAENLKENSYWLSIINGYYYTHVDDCTDYEKLVNSITADDIKRFAKMIQDTHNRTEVIMTAEQ